MSTVAQTERTGRAAPRITGRQTVVLAVLLVAQFMLAVDFSILNVALPAIGTGLGLPLDRLQWIATAFALPAAGFTLLFGRVADLYGRRRLFLQGLALLAAASLAGGLATDPAVLIAARVAQGLATAAVTPAGLALLTTAFPEGPLREKALGLNGALMSAGFTAGAILGGVLTDLLSWRWAFLVNVPVALAVLLIAPRVLAESRPDATARVRLDLPGALTVTGGLLALVLGLTEAGRLGWSHPAALTATLLGVGLLGGFLAVERRAAAPLVPPAVLRRRTVRIGNVIGLLAFLTETSLVFLLTLYLQEVLHFSALAAGLSFGVLGLGTVLGGTLAARVIARLGVRGALLAGGLLQAAATGVLLALGPGGGWLWLLLPATFAGGVGNMLVIVGFLVTATSGLPDREQGTAAGLATMTQQIGITVGTPVMSAVVAAAAPAHGVLGGVGLAVAANTALVLVGVFLATRLAGRR
ncbi:MFS transporter [Streptomyces sp. TLI_171]|uniref:MFS transporter n=1 Tax=Streptomyces sp. TLI_171 TaxID=1938859 RepID=UPI000C18B425|nr:MFS transporter [Streptomyces sp. TLI_171]RKE17553.1 EmrB/QacA subfamily drug resistance transporter [Streptomyces sp. TLI_171]